MFHQHLSTSLWTTRCIPWIYVWLNWVTVLFIIKNLQNSKMATIPNSHKLLKSTRILNLFIKSNWRECFTTQKSCQVSIWSVFLWSILVLVSICFSNQAKSARFDTKLTFVSFPDLARSMWNTFQIVINVLVCTQLALGAFWDN